MFTVTMANARTPSASPTCSARPAEGRSPEPTVWIGLRPAGPDFATYGTTPYADLPPLKVNPLFAGIHTVIDVERNFDMLEKSFESPTGCFFCIPESPEMYSETLFIWAPKKELSLFYSDRQGCVQWYFHPACGVYTDRNQCVAKTIPEFLSRMHLEDKLWFHAAHGRELDQEAKQYLAHRAVPG